MKIFLNDFAKYYPPKRVVPTYRVLSGVLITMIFVNSVNSPNVNLEKSHPMQSLFTSVTNIELDFSLIRRTLFISLLGVNSRTFIAKHSLKQLRI